MDSNMLHIHVNQSWLRIWHFFILKTTVQLLAFGEPEVLEKIRDAGGGKRTRRRCFFWQLCLILPLSLCPSAPPCHPAIVQQQNSAPTVRRPSALLWHRCTLSCLWRAASPLSHDERWRCCRYLGRDNQDRPYSHILTLCSAMRPNVAFHCKLHPPQCMAVFFFVFLMFRKTTHSHKSLHLCKYWSCSLIADKKHGMVVLFDALCCICFSPQ